MDNLVRSIVIGATAITLACCALWLATGADFYTKFTVVESVERGVDPEDPLAAAGFYEEGNVTETVTRDTFRFGLLPTPSGIIDKHSFSVVSICVPVWIATFGLAVIRRRIYRRAAQ